MTPPDARQVAEQLVMAVRALDDRYTHCLTHGEAIAAIQRALSEATARLAAERDAWKKAANLTLADLNRAIDVAVEARARHAEDVHAAYRTGAAEARRQVWEEAARMATAEANNYAHGGYDDSAGEHACEVLADVFRQRALPSEQTETPR